jgi:methylthioribose-1-phosphate isomerase
MIVNGKPTRTIWEDKNLNVIVIDQRELPFEFKTLEVHTVEEMADVILDMVVRGAGLIGASAGYGMALASRQAISHSNPIDKLKEYGELLKNTRPTAVNLAWAVDRQYEHLKGFSKENIVDEAYKLARIIADEDESFCRQLGKHGGEIIKAIYEKKKDTVNILTHCNAGWLAFVDYGSATAPMYTAHDDGIPIHVWVDETRPRNQGASLTAWELGQHGVNHTVIPDNAGGHLMQHGMVDLVIVGADRVTRNGDAANKIGTYLKALSAVDNNVPFYVALPSSTIDWDTTDGVANIPIEQRSQDEVKYMRGINNKKEVLEVRILPENSPCANFGFDVTPARLITGLITERGIMDATEKAILKEYPEKAK